MPHIDRLALRHSLLVCGKLRRLLVRQHDGDAFILGEIDAVLQFHQLLRMLQQLVRILVVHLLVDRHIVDLVVLEPRRIPFLRNHPLQPLIRHLLANPVLVVRDKDELAFLSVTLVELHNSVTSCSRSCKEIQHRIALTMLDNDLKQFNRFRIREHIFLSKDFCQQFGRIPCLFNFVKNAALFQFLERSPFPIYFLIRNPSVTVFFPLDQIRSFKLLHPFLAHSPPSGKPIRSDRKHLLPVRRFKRKPHCQPILFMSRATPFFQFYSLVCSPFIFVIK